MAAATADLDTPFKHRGPERWVGVDGGSKIYVGTIVALNAAGFAIPASDTAGITVIGRAEETVDNTAGADGALKIRVCEGIFRWNEASVVQASMGQNLTCVDDNTVGLAAGTTNDIVVGKLWEMPGPDDPADTCWVKCPA